MCNTNGQGPVVGAEVNGCGHADEPEQHNLWVGRPHGPAPGEGGYEKEAGVLASILSTHPKILARFSFRYLPARRAHYCKSRTRPVAEKRSRAVLTSVPSLNPGLRDLSCAEAAPRGEA